MAGSAAGESILFIGSILITVAFVGVFSGVVQNLSRGVGERGDVLGDELASDIAIINDPLAMTTSPLTVYVKNTGTRAILTPDVSILLDGVISVSNTKDVLGSTDDDTWLPGEVLQITVNDLTVSPGDHRLRVVAPSGVDDTFAFAS